MTHHLMTLQHHIIKGTQKRYERPRDFNTGYVVETHVKERLKITKQNKKI